MVPRVLTTLLLAAAFVQAQFPADVRLKPLFDSTVTPFAEPVWFGEYPGKPGAFLVGELGGRLSLLEPSGAGYRASTFAQIRVYKATGNDGILGIAFHPDFPANRRYFIYYSSVPGETILEERSATAADMDAGSSRILLTHTHKASVHNGGDMHFGADGRLYLGIGDAGNPNVYNNRAQDLTQLPGKMLRLDVDRKDPGREYAIPADNPFADSRDTAVRKEIYAYGLRQPWRWSFDKPTGRLVVGEVGDWLFEEVDVIEKGGNYGWSRREGNTCFNGADEIHPLEACDTAGLKAPLGVIPHPIVDMSASSCIIGGYVFRGNPSSPFYGAYIFGDNETRKLHAMPMDGALRGKVFDIGKSPEGMSSFGMDAKGNLYMTGYQTGLVYRLDHPDLQGSLAVAPRAAPRRARVPARSGDGWLLDASLFPGVEEVRIVALDGRVVEILGKRRLAAGALVRLPRGYYQAVGMGGPAYPLLLR